MNDTPWAGALERVSAYGFMVWLVVLASITLRPYRAGPSRASEPPRADRRELAEALSATADFGRRKTSDFPLRS